MRCHRRNERSHGVFDGGVVASNAIGPDGEDRASGSSSSPRAGLAGLTSEEAESRLERYGPNEIPERAEGALVSLLKRFLQPFTLMIEAAIVVSVVLRDWPDVALICFLLALNISVDFFRERKTESVLNQLKRRMAPGARVLRDGSWRSIVARTLVPGDVVTVRGGDIVPADIKLHDGSLEVDESSLTGESLPVEKSEGETAFSASTVSRGESVGLVVDTGDRTLFGRTASLAGEKPPRSHFERGIDKVGRYVVVLAASCITVIVLVSFLARHREVGPTLLLTLTLLVASIPAALPAVLTVVLSTGANHLAKHDVLVRRLPAIEELASADVICSDKTGTLTTGRLELSDPLLYSGLGEEEVLEMALLCSNYPTVDDPIDRAVSEGASSRGAAGPEAGRWMRTSYVPADPVSKRSACVVKSDGRGRRIIKGAPQVVLAACDPAPGVAERILRDVSDLAARGYRAIALACRESPPFEEDAGMVLAAVLPLRDPPRADTPGTVKAARDLGIEVKMITGDHYAAAGQVATEAGIEGEVATADEIDSWNDGEFASLVEAFSVFAQVLPENKYRIVGALQGAGHIVGMTGDGVNDSPALRKADVGIAVEGATDVARAASDVVLTKPGLSIIIDGVREGKTVFARMKNYVIYRVSETTRIIVFMTLAVLVSGVVPMGPHQIILLAIMNDIPILLISGDNASPALEPESWGMRRLIGIGTLLGMVGVATSFLLFKIFEHYVHAGAVTSGQLTTAMFLKFSISGHLLFFVARQRHHWWSRPRPSRNLLAAILLTMAVSTTISAVGLGSLLPAIPVAAALAVWGWCLAWMQLADLVKLAAYRVADRTTGTGADRREGGAGTVSSRAA